MTSKEQRSSTPTSETGPGISHVGLTEEQLVDSARHLMEMEGDDMNELAEKLNASHLRVRKALGAGDTSMLKRIIRHYTGQEVCARYFIGHPDFEYDMEDVLATLQQYARQE